MLTLFKLLLGSGALTSALKKRVQSIRQTATIMAVLAAMALVAVIVGAVCIAASAFFALRPLMADYQAALLVGGGYIGVAGFMVLVAAFRLKRGTRAARIGVADESTEGAAMPALGPGGADPLVHLIGSAVQSPVVMTALALGIVAGRATKRSRRN